MGWAKVPLYNSDGYGSCQVCGTPTPPHLLSFFDGKWVCRYHRFRTPRAVLEAASARDFRKYRNYIFIEHSLGPIPGGVSPPISTPPPGEGGGGGEPPPPNPGGGGGSGNPPPDPNPPGGTPPGMNEGNLCLREE